VRAANTGISAAIDAYGRVLTRIPLQTDGFRDFRLPDALPPTLYARFGDVPAMSLIVLVFFLCTRRRRLRPGE
jgi:apolipoprotein N-acyltransferase